MTNPSERDILADILNDSHTGSIRGLDELSKLIHIDSSSEEPMSTMAKPALLSKTKSKTKKRCCKKCGKSSCKCKK